MFQDGIASLQAIGASARALRRRPAFTLLSVGLMALGVGAVTAIFAVVNATLLRPLPYRDPNALYALANLEPVNRDSSQTMVLSWLQLSRWRGESRAFSGIEGYSPATMKLLGAGEPEPITGAAVSAGFFDVLGWRPRIGRAFTRADEQAGSGVAIISDGLWKRRFGGDRNVIGRVINLDDEPRAIVGVMPEGFSMLFQPADVWTPMILNAQALTSRSRLVAGIGRLRPGFTAQQGTADLVALNKQLSAEHPDDYRFTAVKVTGLRESIFGAQRANLLVLLAAVLMLLAVATVNAMSLALADGLARRTATMTRLALGASRRAIVRLRLTEMAIVSVAAILLGLGLGRAGLAALAAVSPDAVAGFGSMTLDATVVAVAVAIGILAGVAAGVPAALSDAAVSFEGLAGGVTKSIGASTEQRNRDMLMGAQVALAVLLLVGASLLARNVTRLLSRPPGFTASGVTVVELTFSRTTYATKEQRAQYAERLLDAVHTIPGVEAAATFQTRFVLNENMQSLFEIDGKPAESGVQQLASIRHSTPEILKALGIRLLRGRGFQTTDRMDSPPVALVSASFAKQYWGGDDPIGKRIRRANNQAPWMEVVGVVGDVMDQGAGVEPGPTMYVSYLQQNTPTARPTLVIRAKGSPATLFPAIRKAIWSVDGNQTIDSMTRLDDLMLRSAAQPRFAALVALLFAGGALLLVLSGIYAVTLYSVLRRTRELGVRAALGAQSIDLVTTAMWRSMRPVLAGTGAGALAAVPAANAMRRVLTEGLSAADAPMLVAVVAGLALATAIAAYIPARRALAIPPALAMRG